MRTLPLGPILALVAGCTPPDPDALFNQVALTVAADEAEAAAPFVAAIDDAADAVHAALPAAEDPAVADALLRAWDRGLEVELVIDGDTAAQPAFTALIDAGVPTRLADTGITYFDFAQNLDVSWGSEQTIMAHAFVVTDRRRAVAASTIGRAGAGTRVVFELRGEEIVEDLLSEHVQVFGGTDATAVTAFSNPAKSIADARWRYGTGTDQDLELWFGPQERLTKRVIDAIYAARSAVWVMTDDLANDGLAKALQDKAAWGFDVQVVVGPRFGESSSLLSRVLEDETPDVQKRQLSGVDVVPTVVLIDYPDDPEGYRSVARAMVLNHDLYSAARLYRGQEVETDQLIDAAMWVLSDVTAPGDEMLALEAVFRDAFDAAGGL